MKKHINPLTGLAVLLFLTVWSACSKSSSGSSGPSANTVLITQATWKYDTSGIDLNKDGIVDIGDTTVPVCEKEYTYLFNKDSTGILTEGATKCNPSDPQTENFTWSFTNNQSGLTASINPLLSGGVNIFSLTQTSLILYKDTILLGSSFRYVISLKH
jgi:hypothetical protein